MFLNIEKFLGETEFFLIFIEDLICSPYHIMDSLPADADDLRDFGEAHILTDGQIVDLPLFGREHHSVHVKKQEAHPNREVDAWQWFSLEDARQAIKPGSLARAFLLGKLDGVYDFPFYPPQG